MKKTALVLAAVLAASVLTGCGEKITLHGAEYDLENGKKIVYSCEVNDRKISDAFRKSVEDRMVEDHDHRNNFYLGDIYIEDHNKSGEVVKSGYHFSDGLYRSDNGKAYRADDRMVFVSAIPDHTPIIYESDREKKAEFEDNIMNYLRENTEPEVYELNTAGDKDKIVFLSLYTNYAESYYCKGCFIDTYGDLYSFDFSREPELRGDAEIEKAINEFYMESEPIRQCVCDPERLRQIQTEDVSRIDQNADDNEEFMGCDMGTNSIYVYDESSNKISLCYTGSYSGELQDDTAKELAAYFKNIIN